MPGEGCRPFNSGILEHFEALGPLGVALYTWLTLSMDVGNRTVAANTEDICASLSTGKTQVSRSLKYLEDNGFITRSRGYNGSKSVICVCHPAGCAAADNRCPLGTTESPCRKMKDVARKKKKAEKDEVALTERADIQRILTAWNAQGSLVQHKFVGAKDAKTIDKVITEHGEAAVVEAIGNYGMVMADQRSWFKYKWTLGEFVKRQDGVNITRFSNAAEPHKNFGCAARPDAMAAASEYADL